MDRLQKSYLEIVTSVGGEDLFSGASYMKEHGFSRILIEELFKVMLNEMFNEEEE